MILDVGWHMITQEGPQRDPCMWWWWCVLEEAMRGIHIFRQFRIKRCFQQRGISAVFNSMPRLLHFWTALRILSKNVPGSMGNKTEEGRDVAERPRRLNVEARCWSGSGSGSGSWFGDVLSGVGVEDG